MGETQGFQLAYVGPWPPGQFEYAEVYAQAEAAGQQIIRDPRSMTQEEKDGGLGSVFKRDDQLLLSRRERDSRKKDPNFISLPDIQQRERGEDEDLSKMDMGGRAKGRMQRRDFETEEEWATYNEQKEAMPKAAFQFGVKMQGGRKTRKLNNELHKINQILEKKKDKSGGGGGHKDDRGNFDDDRHQNKRLRV